MFSPNTQDDDCPLQEIFSPPSYQHQTPIHIPHLEGIHINSHIKGPFEELPKFYSLMNIHMITSVPFRRHLGNNPKMVHPATIQNLNYMGASDRKVSLKIHLCSLSLST